MRIVGYIRVSTGDQGLSIEAQRTRIIEYCNFNHYELVDILVDEDVSGSTMLLERPAGGKISDMISKKKIKGVASVKLDRIFRSASDALTTSESWIKSGISMHLIDMNGMSLNTETAMGKMMLTMMAAFAEFERNMISERTKIVLKHKRDNGEKYCRYLPYGFKQEAGKTIPDEVTMQVVKQMREWRSTCSYQKISDRLSAHKVSAPQGEKWNKATVFRIINNPIYANA
jgi:site-specific DNA recombinase